MSLHKSVKLNDLIEKFQSKCEKYNRCSQYGDNIGYETTSCVADYTTRHASWEDGGDEFIEAIFNLGIKAEKEKLKLFIVSMCDDYTSFLFLGSNEEELCCTVKEKLKKALDEYLTLNPPDDDIDEDEDDEDEDLD